MLSLLFVKKFQVKNKVKIKKILGQNLIALLITIAKHKARCGSLTQKHSTDL